MFPKLPEPLALLARKIAACNEASSQHGLMGNLSHQRIGYFKGGLPLLRAIQNFTTKLQHLGMRARLRIELLKPRGGFGKAA